MNKFYSSKHRFLKVDQSGRVTLFSIVIILFLFITIYEFSMIYSDWSEIKKIPLEIRILDDTRLPIYGVNISIDDKLIGQTNNMGMISTLIETSGKIRIEAKKDPLNQVDTSLFLDDAGLKTVFTMARPYATLILLVEDESGTPLADVDITLNRMAVGKTNEEGKFKNEDTLHLNDSVYVKLHKEGFESTSKSIYLSDISISDSFNMAKILEASKLKPKTTKPSKPEPDFQTHYNLADTYLNRAISGEVKYFGKALGEIDKAIKIKPKYLLAKQRKIEILFNFAKSLQNSKLYAEASNRCTEALRMYREIPQDPMYMDILKLKDEIDNKLK